MADNPKVMVEYFKDKKRDEILAMPAGRELDALVAEKVMGYDVAFNKPNEEYVYTVWENEEKTICSLYYVPHYSTDMSAAWEMWTHNRPEDWSYELNFWKGEYTVSIVRQNIEDGYKYMAQTRRESAPEAICICILLAVME